MESLTLDREGQPTNSSEEVDLLDKLQDGRSYECMFCKHGFSTAQALGGHMNIHRKDRAKVSTRRNSSNNKSYYAGTTLCEPCLITSCAPHKGRLHEFMSSSSPIIHDNNHPKYQNPNCLITNPSGEEMRLSLSLQFGWSHEDEGIQRGSEDSELDLELRLGYDP